MSGQLGVLIRQRALLLRGGVHGGRVHCVRGGDVQGRGGGRGVPAVRGGGVRGCDGGSGVLDVSCGDQLSIGE